MILHDTPVLSIFVHIATAYSRPNWFVVYPCFKGIFSCMSFVVQEIFSLQTATLPAARCPLYGWAGMGSFVS
jgi:hypothetical protein